MKKLGILLIALLLYSCRVNNTSKDQLKLEDKLSGKWKATAFDGELHEEWMLNEDGWMMQEGHYIEQNDTSYSAFTLIQKIKNEVILLSVIKNADPKIFKAESVKENEIVFSNSDYKNPFEVKYEFFAEDSYRRTIKGYESDSLVTYEFNFERQNDGD